MGGGVLAEALLIAAVIPIRMAGGSETAITIVAVVGSFLVFVPTARWLARPTTQPVLHGVLMGGMAAAIYLVLSALQQQFDPNAPPVPMIYYVAHVLKLAGGATGGWLAGRAAGSASAPIARVL